MCHKTSYILLCGHTLTHHCALCVPPQTPFPFPAPILPDTCAPCHPSYRRRRIDEKYDGLIEATKARRDAAAGVPGHEALARELSVLVARLWDKRYVCAVWWVGVSGVGDGGWGWTGGRGLIDGELTLTWRVGVVRCSSSLGLPPAPEGYPPKLSEIPRR